MPSPASPSPLATLHRRAFLESAAVLALSAAIRPPAFGTEKSPAPAPSAPAARTSPWQIACYTRPWAAHDYRVALDAIAGAGFRYVGLMTAKGGGLLSLATSSAQAAAYRDEVKARSLSVVSAWGGNFITKPSLSSAIDGLQYVIDRCFECGCPNLLLGGTTKAEHEKIYYDAVAECCGYAAAKGIGLSVKPHGGTNATGPQCRKLIERVSQKNFGLWYDPGNIFYYSDGKLDPVADSALVNGLVVGMCVKDFRPPKEVNITPGTGLVDFARVLANLKAGGFTGGPLVVECLAPGDLAHLKNEAIKTRLFVEKLLS